MEAEAEWGRNEIRLPHSSIAEPRSTALTVLSDEVGLCPCASIPRYC